MASNDFIVYILIVDKWKAAVQSNKKHLYLFLPEFQPSASELSAFYTALTKSWGRVTQFWAILSLKMFFGVVWDFNSLKPQGKQFKQNASPKSYKTEITILANPGLA